MSVSFPFDDSKMFPDLDSHHSEEDIFSYNQDSPDLMGDDADDLFGSMKINNTSSTPYSDATQVNNDRPKETIRELVYYCGPVILVDFENLKIEAFRGQIFKGMGAGVRG